MLFAIARANELVMAGHRASEENMLLAKQCMDEANGDFESAKKKYSKTISLDGIYSTNDEHLPF